MEEEVTEKKVTKAEIQKGFLVLCHLAIYGPDERPLNVATLLNLALKGGGFKPIKYKRVRIRASSFNQRYRVKK